MADSKIDDGGQAFPVPADDKAGWHSQEGMSLRDWFAGQAMAGLLANPNDTPPSTIEEKAAHYARISLIYADAMIAARKAGA